MRALLAHMLGNTLLGITLLSISLLFANTAYGKVDVFQLTDWTDNPRTLRVYLPPSYANSEKRYPVIYMHDGQNLFDADTAYAAEWQIDETLDNLARETGFEAIVIGIDHGNEKRLSELSPWTNPRFGSASGEAYADFVVNRVKPWADNTFRTLPQRQHTAVVGSSMGGLISHYMAFKYPDVFSKAAIFSPSYWYSERVFAFTQQTLPLPDSRLFLLVGGKEGGTMQQDTLAMFQLIQAYTHYPQQTVAHVDAEAEHNELFWRQWFMRGVVWLFQ